MTIESRPLATVTVPLAFPVEWHNRTIRELTLREPTAAQFFKLGEPTVVVHGANGGGSVVDVGDVIVAYLDTCADIEAPAHFLTVLPLADGRAIRKALLGFFRDAPETTSG